MLEVLISKQVDIYIAIATSIFGAVLGLVLSKLFSESPSTSEGVSSVTPRVTINTIKRYSVTIRSQSEQDSAFLAIVGGAFVFFGLTFYTFFRSTILLSLLYSEVFLLSMWIGAVLRSMISGKFNGFTWFVYLVYVSVFMIAYLVAILLAANPIIHPQNFHYAEQIMNQYGWSGMSNYFETHDLQWAAVHLMGICLLIFTFWNMSLSLINIIFSGYSINSGGADSWIVRKTAKYCTPWSNIIVLSIFIFIGGAMVSGIFLQWLQYDIPEMISELFDTVMHGRRSI
ncbi:hypothetical protein C9J44_15940 [Photobacterium sp. GB-27]|uniref:hypothetical protein n=1 Tax=unclassified Photobacterium TaxID=2628852 RepID=UPI000D17647E|nr:MULTISPECIES: hypothetical protein [unclassified Photobacterium]PSV34220.1 hypothetical protein C9J44_15940 [Photobacterium sp. GB-27]PSV58694.1 hypothetical protein C9J43_00025 [Photobacterium sp. GB-3]